MTLFEDTYEVWYEAAKHRDRITGPREADTLVRALREITPQHREESVVVLDHQSADTISDRLGDDVHVTLEDPIVPREHIYLAPRRIEQALSEQTMVLTVESSSPYGLVMDPSCVTYDNQVIDPAGVVGVSFVRESDE